MKWNEYTISRALARQVFQRKHLVIVPNCNWTGDELDLLVITPDLRIIDVEVKISRPDLKADVHKHKWFHSWDFNLDGPWTGQRSGARRRREWPRRVWKHYYAMPKHIWTIDLINMLPSPKCGVITMNAVGSNIYAHVVRRAIPCRDAEQITAADAVDIARLASLRMWDAYDKLNARREEI